jgi:AcrR family transcriptional regulator
MLQLNFYRYACDVAQRISLSGVVPPDEGLRERKKRETRQHISDVATGLFLERGFEEVRVADVAAAAGVSEKTVYNYFATKESLLLDREEEMAEVLRAALGQGASMSSPIEAAVQVILDDTRHLFAMWKGLDSEAFRTVLKFGGLIESVPSLRAAQRDMMDRLTQVAAEAMASRAGVDPLDPEPQIAAAAIVGLWGVQYRALSKQAATAATDDDAHRAVVSEVRRAARLIETGLWSFSLVVQGVSSRDQLRMAAEASSEARKQVMSTLRQARKAWDERARRERGSLSKASST